MDLYRTESCGGVLFFKIRVSQNVIFEGRIVMGQIVQKRIVLKTELSWAK